MAQTRPSDGSGGDGGGLSDAARRAFDRLRDRVSRSSSNETSASRPTGVAGPDDTPDGGGGSRSSDDPDRPTGVAGPGDEPSGGGSADPTDELRERQDAPTSGGVERSPEQTTRDAERDQERTQRSIDNDLKRQERAAELAGRVSRYSLADQPRNVQQRANESMIQQRSRQLSGFARRRRRVLGPDLRYGFEDLSRDDQQAAVERALAGASARTVVRRQESGERAYGPERITDRELVDQQRTREGEFLNTVLFGLPDRARAAEQEAIGGLRQSYAEAEQDLLGGARSRVPTESELTRDIRQTTANLAAVTFQDPASASPDNPFREPAIEIDETDFTTGPPPGFGGLSPTSGVSLLRTATGRTGTRIVGEAASGSAGAGGGATVTATQTVDDALRLGAAGAAGLFAANNGRTTTLEIDRSVLDTPEIRIDDEPTDFGEIAVPESGFFDSGELPVRDEDPFASGEVPVPDESSGIVDGGVPPLTASQFAQQLRRSRQRQRFRDREEGERFRGADEDELREILEGPGEVVLGEEPSTESAEEDPTRGERERFEEAQRQDVLVDEKPETATDESLVEDFFNADETSDLPADRDLVGEEFGARPQIFPPFTGQGPRERQAEVLRGRQATRADVLPDTDVGLGVGLDIGQQQAQRLSLDQIVNLRQPQITRTAVNTPTANPLNNPTANPDEFADPAAFGVGDPFIIDDGPRPLLDEEREFDVELPDIPLADETFSSGIASGEEALERLFD